MISYLSTVDDAVCQYQCEILEPRGVMAFIRELDRCGGGSLGELLTEDNEPMFLVLFGLVKRFEDAGATMCKRIRDGEAVFHAAQTPEGGTS